MPFGKVSFSGDLRDFLFPSEEDQLSVDKLKPMEPERQVLLLPLCLAYGLSVFSCLSVGLFLLVYLSVCFFLSDSLHFFRSSLARSLIRARARALSCSLLKYVQNAVSNFLPLSPRSIRPFTGRCSPTGIRPIASSGPRFRCRTNAGRGSRQSAKSRNGAIPPRNSSKRTSSFSLKVRIDGRKDRFLDFSRSLALARMH